MALLGSTLCQPYITFMYANCPSPPLQKCMYIFKRIIEQKFFFHARLFTMEKAQKSGIKIQISLQIQCSMHLNSIQFDSIWHNLTQFNSIWFNSIQFKSIQMILTQLNFSNSICINLTQFDSIWLNLTQFDSIWLNLTQFDSIWLNLTQFD
jgi:uncharacterized protein YozE (UPF0346 family)